MSAARPIERALPWVARASWILTLLAGGRSLDGVVTDLADREATVVRVAALVIWIAGVAAMAVPAVVSLTATRALVPASIPVAVTAWIAGAPAVDAASFVAVATVTTVVVMSAEFGRAFVQASAYGDEDRHTLRPPAPYLMVALGAWLFWIAIGLAAAIAGGRGAWAIAAGLTVLTVGGAAFGLPRWHRLSRRWLVLVPVGLVVHDGLVLGETVMLRREQIARLGLAPAGTDAADLTGLTVGHALEIRTHEPITVIVDLTPGRRRGTTMQVTACLVAPTRPGRVLAAASERRLPVGAVG